ncbi:hypothetical protein GBAR_LOCUS21610, partial [Geodia barretti]
MICNRRGSARPLSKRSPKPAERMRCTYSRTCRRRIAISLRAPSSYWLMPPPSRIAIASLL